MTNEEHGIDLVDLLLHVRDLLPMRLHPLAVLLQRRIRVDTLADGLLDDGLQLTGQ